jgi:hypothetical protein
MKASATAIKSPRCGTPPCEGTVGGGNQSLVAILASVPRQDAVRFRLNWRHFLYKDHY